MWWKKRSSTKRRILSSNGSPEGWSWPSLYRMLEFGVKLVVTKLGITPGSRGSCLWGYNFKSAKLGGTPKYSCCLWRDNSKTTKVYSAPWKCLAEQCQRSPEWIWFHPQVLHSPFLHPREDWKRVRERDLPEVWNYSETYISSRPCNFPRRMKRSWRSEGLLAGKASGIQSILKKTSSNRTP